MIFTVNGLPVTVVGVPESTPVPGVKVSQLGKSAVSTASVGVGVPVAVTVKVNAVPAVAVAVAAEVKAGATPPTVIVSV